MFTTAVLIAVFAAALIFQLALWLVLLKLGAVWAKVHHVTFGRLLTITLLVFLAQICTVPFCIGRNSSPLVPAIFALPFVIAAGFVLPIVLIQAILRASLLQALKAWLPTLLVNVLGFGLALLVIRYVTEAFYIPTNGMAPTILGEHFTVTCPDCGEAAYGSVPPHGRPEMETPTICEHFHMHEVMPSVGAIGGDRVLVAKYLRPQRWDVIAFRYPGDPTINYIKRLVGLPGETIYIKNGAVWINGQRLEPPSSLKGLSYVTEMPHAPPNLRIAGTPENPAVLGPDEYFVLGDFSSFSADSRLWERGAPGHPAFAVPASNIIGVATHIYWPPSRWRILR